MKIKTSLCFAVVILMAFAAGADSSLSQSPQPSKTSQAISEDAIPEALQGEFDSSDIAAATAWADKLNMADWLGPLAPLALSPFFGVACLSGLSLWGPEWITDNALLGKTGPLCSVPLFCIFAVLALLTSLPRLSKVSKPFAQAMDRLEAYAVIVILLAIKLTSSYGGTPELMDPSVIPSGELASNFSGTVSPVVYQAGVFSFTMDTLLMIAMVINLLVVNSVKFFFEVLVWLTPIPTVDAIFEVCNKTTCAALMAVYAASPAAATVLNLLILLVALVAFRWAGRRVRFFRTMMLDPVLAKVWSKYGLPGKHGLIVFPQSAVGPYPAKSCLRLIRSSETSGSDAAWKLSPASSWSPLSWGLGREGVTLPEQSRPTLKQGWLTHSVEVQVAGTDGDGESHTWVLTTSRRYDSQLDTLVETMKMELCDEATQTDQSADQSRIEFA